MDGMSKYRKKPVVIDAFRLGTDEWPDWYQAAVRELKIVTDLVQHLIPTLEGTMQAWVGDYIIRGVAGEIYPCETDIFSATYEAVRDEE